MASEASLSTYVTVKDGGGGGGGGDISRARSGFRAVRSFKLRFAAEREPGRSYVSTIRPVNLRILGTACPIVGSICRRDPSPEGAVAARARVHVALTHRPIHKYPEPILTSHEYGWWVERLQVHLHKPIPKLHNGVR